MANIGVINGAVILHGAGDFLSFGSWGLIVPTEMLAPMPDPVEPVDQ